MMWFTLGIIKLTTKENTMKTAFEIKEKMKGRIMTQTTSKIKEMVVEAQDNFDDTIDIILPMLLDVLESRLSDSEFCEFCNNL